MRHLGGFTKEKRERSNYEKQQTTFKRSILKKERDEKKITNFRLGSKDLTKYRNVCGIYKISARYSKTIAYKSFVGCSTNLHTRFTNIKHQLLKGSFTNKSIQKLFDDRVILVFELVEVCTENNMGIILNKWMGKLRGLSRNGYNKRDNNKYYQESKPTYTIDTLPNSIKDKKYTFENYNNNIENLTIAEMSIKHNIEVNILVQLLREDKTSINGWYMLGSKKPLYTLTNTKTDEVIYNLTSYRISNTGILSRCQISQLLSDKVKTAKGYKLTLQEEFINN